jgi:hypothetical protein
MLWQRGVRAQEIPLLKKGEQGVFSHASSRYHLSPLDYDPGIKNVL